MLALLLIAVAPASGAGPPDKRKLDTFFSNFAETGITSCRVATVDDATLIRFAAEHYAINEMTDRSVTDSKGRIAVSAATIDHYCLYYFGKRPGRHRAVPPDIDYRSGTFWLSWGEGDPVLFAEAGPVSPAGAGRYRISVTFYSAPNDFEGDRHALPGAWQALPPGERPTVVARRTAIIDRIAGPSQHFVLVSLTPRSAF